MRRLSLVILALVGLAIWRRAVQHNIIDAAAPGKADSQPEQRPIVAASSQFARPASLRLSRLVDVVMAAQSIQERYGFVLLMEFSAGSIEIAYSWLCNTRSMQNVHNVTMMVTDDVGFAQMQSFLRAQNWPVSPTLMRSGLPRRYQASWDYGTKGYWITTQYRVHTVCALLHSGVNVFIAEPDALWVKNPLLDSDLMHTGAEVAALSDGNGGTVGFGFLFIQSTNATQDLFSKLRDIFDDSLAKVISAQPADTVGVEAEQWILTRLLRSATQSGTLRMHRLDRCRYPDGQWYDGGRQTESPETYRSHCAESGGSAAIVVLQNNWIVGNDAKKSRARRWGHWFLEEDRPASCLPLEHSLLDARQSLLSLQAPGGDPSPVELKL